VVQAWQQRYIKRFYSGNRGWIDGTEEFHRLCRQVIGGSARILEIGAGPSNQTSRFLATCGELHGVDPDPSVMANDALTTAAVISNGVFPVTDAWFDCCVSNYVLEHVADPEMHLREVARVLKPDGAYVFRTPNRYHYVSLVSSLTPHWFHELVANRLRNLSSDSHDPYPTVYALNSSSAIRRWATAVGLHVDQLRLVEKEPSYGMRSRALFLALTAYERIVNSTGHLASLRANIFGVLRKQVAAGSGQLVVCSQEARQCNAQGRDQ
jgi:2-polyprenyl-3-methyl-5-hydroxy-6-metoxy-1,4-benzoquinol methylase